jgi:integrase/recombinase XerD
MRYVPTETEILMLLNKPDTTTLKGIRDKAILELLYSSALRRSELASLNIDHVNLNDKSIRIVKGKGDKDRFIPMTTKAAEAIMLYLEKARPLYNKDPTNKVLFLGEWGRRLSPCMINEIIHEYARFNPKISTHSIRHATATHMLKRGANIIHLQRLLGHSSPKTTQIYTKLYPKDLIQIYNRVHPRSNSSRLAREPFPKERTA